MAEQTERPRPHGDLLENARGEQEENDAQRNSDATPDAEQPKETSDRDDGRGSTANGVPAFDEDDGARRRKLYEEGAGLVSRID